MNRNTKQAGREESDVGPAESGLRVTTSSQDRQQIVDLDFLRGLIAAVDDSGIDSLEVARGGTRIRISKSPPASAAPMVAHAAAPAAASHPAAPAAPPAAAPAAAPGSAAADSGALEVKSPMVGTFYRAPAPEAPPYVEVGSRVVKGQTLCILEAMKLMNELEAEVSGVVREVCVENAEPVEYGQVLFRIEPDA
jgi:acetyl-CoA carboxylase biotin carboxyl carrier protein